MTRRLVLSFTFVAILSVLLTAIGVAALSSLEQRSNAAADLEVELDSVAGLITRPTPRQLNQRARQIILQRFDLVTISPDGQASELRASDSPLAFEPLSDAQVAELFEDGFTLIEVDAVSEDGVAIEADIAGLKRVEGFIAAQADLQDSVIAVYGARRTSPFSRDIALWFVISFLLATLVALIAGSFLARRLNAPISAIEQVTKRISVGELEARVVESGPPEVAALGASVNQMASELQSSKQLDRQFLLSVSHDLRTPLTVIKGYAEALEEGAVDNPQQIGSVLKNHADRLDYLVTDLLDLARIDANRFEFHTVRFDLSLALNELCQGVDVKAKARDLSFLSAIEPNLFVSADKQRCLQIVGNLADNALKYTSTKVEVEAVANAEWIDISVIDDGPGISEAEIDKIFGRFYISSKDPESSDKSYGLGLAIAKELATAMGAEISVQSRQSFGTTMRLRLRLSKL